jgi:hypothetical protein
MSRGTVQRSILERKSCQINCLGDYWFPLRNDTRERSGADERAAPTSIHSYKTTGKRRAHRPAIWSRSLSKDGSYWLPYHIDLSGVNLESRGLVLFLRCSRLSRFTNDRNCSGARGDGRCWRLATRGVAGSHWRIVFLEKRDEVQIPSEDGGKRKAI